MNIRPIIFLILLSLSLGLTAQEKRKVQFNYGIKAGFQAVTYNDPEFEIDGYVFDTDNIQSNRIGYAISPFVRLTKNKFFIQTEATFGITNHSFDFHDEVEPGMEDIVPNKTVYDLRTYCIQVPILFWLQHHRVRQVQHEPVHRTKNKIHPELPYRAGFQTFQIRES